MFNDSSSGPVIEHVVFISNFADGAGGGVCNNENSSLDMNDAAFIDNGSQSGGGIYNGSLSSVNMKGVSFTENAGKYGG